MIHTRLSLFEHLLFLLAQTDDLFLVISDLDRFQDLLPPNSRQFFIRAASSAIFTRKTSEEEEGADRRQGPTDHLYKAEWADCC